MTGLQGTLKWSTELVLINSENLSIVIALFGGQGTTAAQSDLTRLRAIADARSPSGSTLLTACHQAFCSELAALSDIERSKAEIDIGHFSEPSTLLPQSLPQSSKNPILSNSSIFLVQALRYLAFLEADSRAFSGAGALCKPDWTGLSEVVGFSSGILAACLAATSTSLATYISRAVELYRLALWVGVRAQLHRSKAEGCIPMHDRHHYPWSVVLMGLSRTAVQDAIQNFRHIQDDTTNQVVITAVTDTTCITISGRPDILRAFCKYITSSHGAAVTCHETSIHALYHSPANTTLRDLILEDVTCRKINFPDFKDIAIPLRSTVSGVVLNRSTLDAPEFPASLLHAIVDMLILQPVDWELVASSIDQVLPDGADIRILNFGPGGGVASSMERMIQRSGRTIQLVDVSRSNDGQRKDIEPKYEPIAIVGMAVNLPGAPNVSKLWEVLEKGLNTVCEIPEQRFKVSDYDGRNPKRQMKAHMGNFIDDVDEFDNRFFKISPREARSMDPQQRILLHTAYEALEDSGYVPDATPSFSPETFGCYVGATSHDYVQNLRNDIDVFYNTGTLNALLCGRVSYVMQFSGPSVVVDTACSASCVAFYHACRALVSRDCNAALAGGINVISSPDLFIGLDRAHFLSPTGQCKAFDISADGYCRSDGCGMFVLKRLSDAVAENDRILGVIRAVDVNQSGRAYSVTHPHAETQAKLFKSLLENAGIADPSRVNVVEAHGTGTQAGDPNELESIRSILCANRTPDNPLHVTSIKANIGHPETASGAAGLAKLLLMLQHQTIPRQISLRTLNPRIAPLGTDHTIIDRVAVPWQPSHHGMTRLALLNNFGAGGSNTAMLVEEYIPKQTRQAQPVTPLVCGFSAKDERGLEALRKKYLDWLQNADSEGCSFPDIAYTMTARRQLYSYRTAVCASDKADLIEKLRRTNPQEIMPEQSKFIFVLSGQGSQYLGMGRELYATFDVFKSEVDGCQSILLELGFTGVLSIITADSQQDGLESVQDQEAYQAAVFVVEYALAKLWMSWGVIPSAVIGHSLGEYAALVLAEVLSLRSALTLVANRARLMFQRCQLDSSGMIAVNLPSERVNAILESHFPELSIACYNSPGDVVVAGSVARLSLLKAYLEKEVGCKSTVLNVPFGYHSEDMRPIQSQLAFIASEMDISPPVIPISSNVLGLTVHPGDATVFDVNYFGRHCVEPVQFDAGIRLLVESCELGQNDVWIEIGPHPTSLPLLKSNPTIPSAAMLLPSMRKKQDPCLTLMTSLSLLYSRNVGIRWREVFSHVTPSCIGLPSYPFSKQKFWVPYVEEYQTTPSTSTKEQAELAIVPRNSSPVYTMVHSLIQIPSQANGFTAILETPVDRLSPWIVGHRVREIAICPASVYTEMALCAVALSSKRSAVNFATHHTLLRNMDYVKPLIYDPSHPCTVTVTVKMNDSHGSFIITSRHPQSPESTVHVKGDYCIERDDCTSDKLSAFLPSLSSRILDIASKGSQAETFYTRTAYDTIFSRLVQYDQEYRGTESVSVTLDGTEGCAQVKLPSRQHIGTFSVHPILLDCLLHVSGFVVNMHASENKGYICHKIDSLEMVPANLRSDARYIVYCRALWSSEKEQVMVDVWAQQAETPNYVVLHAKNVKFTRVDLDSFSRANASHRPTTSQSPIQSLPLAMNERAHPSLLTPSHQDTDSVEAFVLRTVADIYGMAVSTLSLSSRLNDIGFDPLMIMELTEKLTDNYPGAQLDNTSFSSCQTIAQLVQVASSCVTGTPLSTTRSISPESESAQFPPTPESIDESMVQVSQDLGIHIRRELATVLNVPLDQIQEDTRLDLLGLDSLASIEVTHALKLKHSLEISRDFFILYPTIRAVKAHLATRDTISAPKDDKPSIVEGSDEAEIVHMLRLDANPVLYQEPGSPGGLPIFLIHDGSGLANYYERLSPLHRSVSGIHNPRFLQAERWNNLTEMAKVYADFIINKAVSGSVIIGGWSFGSVAAYETAAQIQLRLGDTGALTVKGLLLIDPPNPIDHVPMPGPLVRSIIKQDTLGSLGARSLRIRELIQDQFSLNAELLGKYNALESRKTFGGTPPPAALLRSKDSYKSAREGDIVPTWLSNRTDPDNSRKGWEELTTGLRVWDIPGNHFQPFEQVNVSRLGLSVAVTFDDH
uniref:Putative polyketide synthase n=1 Tax=Moniliophthora roreri TaxID=221103 RepID=A0A0W0G8P1_MONRR